MELSTLLPLATAFGLALLHSLWIGAVLYVVVRALLPLLGGPAARHNLAYGALLATFAGFVYAFYHVYDPAPVCENLLVAGMSLTQSGELGLVEAVQQLLPSFAPWLSALYLFGLVPAIFFLLRDQRRVRVLRTTGITAIPPTWATRLGEELAEHPATRRVRCYLSERAGEVMTLGFWNPVIVFPVALVNELTPEMARTILLHEIAHLRHYDHWLNYPQQFLRTVFFFHPAVHGFCRLIDREREHRCDDWVAARCDDRRTYATALVTVARSSHIPANHLVMSATKTPFSARIQRLFLGDDLRKDGKFAFPVLLFVLLGMALSYSNLGGDAGAVDCLEEQSKPTTLAPAAEPDDQTALLAYRQSKRQLSADEPWAVTPPAVTLSPCRSRLTVEDLPYIAAPEPPASTHPRAMESYERALMKYNNIRYGNSTTSPTASTDQMLGLKTKTYSLNPCPKRKAAAAAKSKTTNARVVPRATVKLKPRQQTLSSARVTSNYLDYRLGRTPKNIGYCINGKTATKAEVKALDTREIADINVIELKLQTKSRCPGADGLVVITTKS